MKVQSIQWLTPWNISWSWTSDCHKWRGQTRGNWRTETQSKYQ